jgi:hypothetical protein
VVRVERVAQAEQERDAEGRKRPARRERGDPLVEPEHDYIVPDARAERLAASPPGLDVDNLRKS